MQTLISSINDFAAQFATVSGGMKGILAGLVALALIFLLFSRLGGK
jgi:hypothetical protein